MALVSEPLPTDAVDDTDPTYRRLSPLAVLSAVAGLASATALVAPLLWVVPVAGVVLAIVALRSIAERSESLTGHGLALFGMALSLALGVGAVVKNSVEQRLHQAAAAEVAEKFLTLLAEDKTAEAFELTLDFAQRRSAETVADYYATNPTAAERLQTFGAERLIAEVTPLDNPKVELVDPGVAQLNVSRVAIAPVFLLSAGDRKLYAIVQLDRSPRDWASPPLGAWRVTRRQPLLPADRHRNFSGGHCPAVEVGRPLHTAGQAGLRRPLLATLAALSLHAPPEHGRTASGFPHKPQGFSQSRETTQVLASWSPNVVHLVRQHVDISCEAVSTSSRAVGVSHHA